MTQRSKGVLDELREIISHWEAKKEELKIQHGKEFILKEKMSIVDDMRVLGQLIHENKQLIKKIEDEDKLRQQ